MKGVAPEGRRGLFLSRIVPVLPELTAIGCFVALLWAVIGVGLSHEYNAAESQALESTRSMARVFEEGTKRTIGQIDNILLSSRAFYAALGGRFDFAAWVKSQIPPDAMRAQISMTDASGRVTASTLPLQSGISVADRPHFKVHLDPARDDLFISLPVRGRVSGKDTIQFTRKLLGPQGEFAGIVVFSLDCAELSRFYEAVDRGTGVATLLSAGGVVLARGPFAPELIGTTVAGRGEVAGLPGGQAGSFTTEGARGGQIVSFRRLREYPLTVAVGADIDTVFRDYRSLQRHAVISGIAITLALCVIGARWIAQKQRGLASSRALMITLNTIGQGIIMVDRQGGVPVVNARALEFLGLRNGRAPANASAIVERATELEVRHKANEHAPSAYPDNARNESERRRVFETAHDDGHIVEVHTYDLPDGEFVQTYTDVTEKRIADARVRYLAYHDNLTGLANRAQLRETLFAILARGVRDEEMTALFMVDLDGFKGVNDTLGHQAGDAVLLEVARRLQSLVRATDTVARLGGDEFVILVPGLRDRYAAVPLVERVLKSIAAPQEIGGQQVRIGASVGIVFHPEGGEDADSLLKNGDIAMYNAKSGGRGAYRFFDPSMALAASEHRQLENDLRGALEDGGLDLHFQPKFDCGGQKVVGFEALARWKHPVRGYISPATFIPVAEVSGLINPLGLWALERACATAMEWEPRLPVAVNVSVAQLRGARLCEEIGAILRRTGLAPAFLEIEVTESVLAEEDEDVLANLRALKSIGLRIALDDFGTGYSSLSYLRRFPFDKIKIDKSFVQSLEDDRGARIILEALVGMCNSLGLGTVAEGVETRKQLQLLQDLGCSELQGYLLGRPMPADRIPAFISNGLPAAHAGGDQSTERQVTRRPAEASPGSPAAHRLAVASPV